MTGFMELCASVSLQDYGSLDGITEFENTAKLWTNQCGYEELISPSQSNFTEYLMKTSIKKYPSAQLVKSAIQNGYLFSVSYFLLCYPIAHPRSANINTTSITIPSISLIAPSKSPCPTSNIKKPITAITARIPMIVNICLPPLIVVYRSRKQMILFLTPISHLEHPL